MRTPARYIFRLLLTLVLGSFFFIPQHSVLAMQCGINIDPANGTGYPSPAALAGVKWVRIEYKDCTSTNPPEESVKLYRDVLAGYKAAGIQTLVILDYLTYPDGKDNLEALAERTTYINQELGDLIDAYEIWNEPDIGQGGNLPPQKFAEIVNAVVPTLGGKTTVIGGFASGQVSYFQNAQASITANYSAVSVHPYAKSVDGYPAGMTGDMGALIQEYRSASGKDVWITEIGIDTRNSEQIQRYLQSVFQKNYSEHTFWFAWSDGMVPPFGIVDASGIPKENYDEFFQACGAPLPTTTATLPYINPPGGQSCGGGPGGAPDRDPSNMVSEYPLDNFLPFDTDDLDYYLQPIAGLSPDVSTSKIRQDLALQGYQAYCATPRYSINPSYGTEDLIDRFLRQGNAGVLLPVTSTFEMKTQESEYPLFRDVEGKRWLTSSIEEFWGFKDVVTEDYRIAEINSAPVNSLLNQTQRCTQSVKTLYAIEEMCDKLETPSECVLYKRIIPGTEINTYDLLASYKQYVQGDNDAEKIENYCQEIIRDETAEELKKQLLITPLYIDRAYRLGFIVASIKQRRDENDRVFNFLSTNERAGMKPGVPPHEVAVVAFKLPDILTNKAQVAADNSEHNSEKSNYATGWNDPALLTRNILLPQATIDDLEQKGVKQRQQIYELAEKYALQTADNSIYCLAKGDAPGGVTSSLECQNPLSKAVVDIINAHQLNCGGFKGEAEPSKDISDPAGLQTTTPPIFTDQYGRNLIANLFRGSTLAKVHPENPQGGLLPDQAVLEFVSNFRIDVQPWKGQRGSDVTVDFYLVYPMGYDLETVEDAIAGAFFTEEQQSLLSRDEYFKKFFEMDVDRQFAASTNGQTFTDQEDCRFDNSVRRVVCEVKTFTVSVGSEAYDTVKLLGGRLGFWMRTIQRSLNPLNSDAQEYFTGCTTTEEFLLGKCGARSPILQSPQSPIQASYCGGRMVNNLTNRSKNLRVVEAGSRKEVDKSFILDDSLGAEFNVQLAIRFVDAATLVTNNVLTTTNPAQNSAGRCGSTVGGTNPPDNPALLELWRLPLEYRDANLQDVSVWNQHGHILTTKIDPGSYTNITLNVMVKPGVYGLRVQGSACHMPSAGTKLIAPDGTESNLYDQFFVFDPNPTSTTLSTDYCGTLTVNSNMPGGGFDNPEKENQKMAGACDLLQLGASRYNVSEFNSSCGGLTGRKTNDYWERYVSDLDNAPQVIQDGVAQYKKIFGRNLTVPSGDYTCGDLFPNTFQQTNDCSSVSNGDVNPSSDLGTIPEFKINRWLNKPGFNTVLDPEWGPEITFRMPEDPEVVSAIVDASNRYQCDPLLLLATLNSESFSYQNVIVENGATAMGIAQFTRGSWDTWWKNGCHQPPEFSAPTPRPTLSDRADIQLSIDAACRHMLWTGAQKFPTDRHKFIIAFALQHMDQYERVNYYGQIWNVHSPQADYVYRLWEQLRLVTGSAPIPQERDLVAACE